MLVDDCLVYDNDFPSHVRHVRDVLLCAREHEHGITFSASKFVFGSQHIHFFGYVVTLEFATFRVPMKRTDVRSSVRLVNQCSEFKPHLVELRSPLRRLLKTSTSSYGMQVILLSLRKPKALCYCHLS